MIENLIIAGLIGFMISNVILVISSNRWRMTAEKLQCSVTYYEGELRRQRESQGKAWEEVKEMKHGRDHLQKRLNDCSFEEDRLRAKIAELTECTNNAAENHYRAVAEHSKREAELVSLQAKYESVERAMVLTKDQRDAAISAGLALSERLETLQGKIAERLNAIKTELATLPEPAE